MDEGKQQERKYADGTVYSSDEDEDDETMQKGFLYGKDEDVFYDGQGDEGNGEWVEKHYRQGAALAYQERLVQQEQEKQQQQGAAAAAAAATAAAAAAAAEGPTVGPIERERRRKQREREEVERQRRQQEERQKKANGGGCATFGSDGQLSCPMCFSVVCMDCQRHVRYKQQYRAVFATGVKINQREKLRYGKGGLQGQTATTMPSSPPATGSGLGPGEEGGECDDLAEDEYHPVSCEECGTDVGVVDCEEVFHFFNIIVSG